MTVRIRDEAQLRAWLVDYFLTVVGCDAEEVDAESTLSDLGLSSSDAVALAGEMSELLGRPVSPLDFWEYPTINALSSHLMAPAGESVSDAESHITPGPANDPIAVVGIGCRLPGGIDGPDALWHFLCQGRNAIGEVPADRWSDFDDGSPETAAILSSTSRWGSFLPDIDAFDAEFFEISPSEAAKMDPQQRLLLEVAWEALEHAGIPATSLRRSPTGVFAGACLSEYGYLASKDLSQVDAWTGTGGALSIIANRLSYVLDLRGPSVAVDTACSSSLVAIHLACQSLRTAECDLALAAGVNLVLSPVVTRSFDDANAMSPTGGCHAFDAGADGFVRGEGCGVVVLKRLGDAVRDGDSVLAVVRGSAVNQDGRSNGLMAPSPSAQSAVLRTACARAGLDPSDVDYVEAHGTGTLLGDPIEARALGATFGRGRSPDAPLLIGSVKSNVGHLEAAAGVAGFIKAVLAVQRGHIPPNLDFKEPNPLIPFDELRLKVVSQPTDWPDTGRPRRAGVSSFGFGGTNAHVVVEQGPDGVGVGGGLSGSVVSSVVVSGRSVARVRSWAGLLAEWMVGAGAQVSWAEVAHGVNHHRAVHPVFGSVCARDRVAGLAGLRALAAGGVGPGVVEPHVGRCGSGTVFVYSGQGSQWVGMGRQLLVDEPAFAAAVADLEPDFVAAAGFSLVQTLAGGAEVVGIERIQPVLVGIQLGLTQLWRSYGVIPDAVIGHSVGEVSAAVAAGVLSAAEGLGVVATRSRLMSGLSGCGAMALVELDAGATEEVIAGFAEVGVAVYASPRQTVIAGPPEQVDAVVAVVAGRGRWARRIEVEVASHHRIVDPVLAPLRAALAGLSPRRARVRWLSTTVDGEGVGDGEYWAANVRQPVRFAQAVAAAGRDHVRFIEVSPHPLVTFAIGEILAGRHHHAIATLVRDSDDTVTFHTHLNAAHTTSAPPTEHPPEPHPKMPATAWQHTHHWITPPNPPRAAGAHPLLGSGVTDPKSGTRIWENSIGPNDLWLGDHSVDGMCVLPGAAYAEITLAAVTEAFGDSDHRWTIRELLLERLMHLGDNTSIVTMLTGDESRAQIEIGTRSSTSGWIRHATATVEPAGTDDVELTLPLDDPGAVAMDPADLYERLRGAGQQHGPAFQGITELSVSSSGSARAGVALPSSAKLGSRQLLLHPVVVDIALQTLGATKVAAELAAATTEPVWLLPTRLAGIETYGDVTESVRVISSLHPADTDDRFVGQAFLLGADDRVLLKITEIDAVLLRVGGRRSDLTSRLFTLASEPISLETIPETKVTRVLLIGEDNGQGSVSDPLTTTLQAAVEKRTGQCRSVAAGDADKIREAIEGEAWDAIAVVCPPRSLDESRTEQEQLELAQTRTLLVAEIVKTVAYIGARNSPRLWIVTRGAQRIEPGDSVTLSQSQLRGIARVLTFEHPELRTSLLDVDADGTQSAAAVVDELLADSGHDEVAVRHGERSVRRLVPVPTTARGQLMAEERDTTVDVAGSGAFEVRADRDTEGRRPRVYAAQRTSPGAEEIEVRVTAAASATAEPVTVRGCVGVVTAVGHDVTSIRSGDRVVALGSRALASHLTAHRDIVVPIPNGLSDSEAVAYSSGYLIALTALRDVGRLQSGERILIHRADDEISLAAVAVAKTIGAHVYIEDLCDPTAADKVLRVTDGAGVDVVLNSGPGEAIRIGIQTMAAGGRFVQVATHGPGGDTSLGIAALARSGSFSVVDIDVNLTLDPGRCRRVVEELFAAGTAGELAPPALIESPLADLGNGLLGSISGRRGETVITLPAEGRIDAIAPRPGPLVQRDGGYVVVGGLGGVGFAVARWLVEQGAGLVVISGRTGPDSETSAAISELNTPESRLEPVLGDISDETTAWRLVEAVEGAGFRLRGVVHCAADLADQIVLNMSADRVARVFAPKVRAGWWLHKATAGRDLDWWVAFSSAASLLGSPGQSAYAAANSWLDGLVAYRRARGLPAVGINWGPWAEVGRAQAFADLGFSMTTVEQGLTAMSLLLEADRGCTGVFGLDARQWFQSFPAASRSSLFSALRDMTVAPQHDDGRIRAELDALDAGDRAARLGSLIADEIRAVVRSAEPIDHDAALASLGLDSLMGLELRNRLEARLNITLPVALVWAYPTITELAGAMCDRLGYPESTVTSTPEPGLSADELALLSDVVAASELQAAMGADDS